MQALGDSGAAHSDGGHYVCVWAGRGEGRGEEKGEEGRGVGRGRENGEGGRKNNGRSGKSTCSYLTQETRSGEVYLGRGR